MNSIEYVRTEAVRGGYAGNITFDLNKNIFRSKDKSFTFMYGREFTEDQIENIRSGEYLQKEVTETAAKLEAELIRQARDILRPYGLPMDEYKCDSVEFEGVTANIYFSRGDCEITVHDVYFSDTDFEILQYCLRLR